MHLISKMKDCDNYSFRAIMSGHLWTICFGHIVDAGIHWETISYNNYWQR